MQEVTGMDTVLIVDDSSFIVEGLIAFLKKKYRTLAAYGGAECLEILKREIPSVIILDIMMEPMDGWETLARIKEDKKTRHIPVLMFSAKKISPSEAEEHRINIDDFITKPVSPKKIIEAIEKVLARRDTNRMIVERWQAAGVGQEKIEEYLKLVTSLEVDLSLCQNMKVQYDLVHPEDRNHEEFHAVIRAIEGRILLERDLIQTMAREMNDVLAVSIGSKEPAGPRSSPAAGEPSGSDQETGTGNEVLSPLFLAVKPDGITAAVTAADVQQSPPEAEPGHAGVPVSGIPPDPPAFPGQPGPGTPPSGREPDLQESGPRPEQPATGKAAGGAGMTLPDLTVIRAVPLITTQGGAGSQPPATAPVQQESIPEKTSGPASRAGPSVPPSIPPVSDIPVAEERNVIPAGLDLPPDGTGTAPPTGAGTDVPMPWDTARDRKPQQVFPERDKKAGIATADPITQGQGLFFRIISLVRSVFGKKR